MKALSGKQVLCGLTITITAVASVVAGCKARDKAPASSVKADGSGIGLLPLTELTATRVFPNLSFNEPTALVQEPGNNRIWYVAQKTGQIFSFANDDATTERRLILDISDKVVSGEQENVTFEEGLGNIIFHPRFAEGRREVFAYYNILGPKTPKGQEQSNLFVRLAQFTMNAAGQLENEEVILEIKKDRGNHNGGGMAFDDQGMLLLGVGDGGKPADPDGRGVDPAVPLAKILRIDIDKKDPGKNYAVPADNPLVGVKLTDDRGRTVDFLPEIFSWGHRNPWRFIFDQETKQIIEAEVGQDKEEEINRVQRGAHHGWSAFEGLNRLNIGRIAALGRFRRSDGQAVTPVAPIHRYDNVGGASVTGGFIYRGKDEAMKAYVGLYIYGEFAKGTLHALIPNASGQFEPGATKAANAGFQLGSTGLAIASFAEDADRNIYFVGHQNGALYRVGTNGLAAPDPSGASNAHLFLSRDGVGTEATANKYYQDIGANQSAPTLAAWKSATKFIDGTFSDNDIISAERDRIRSGELLAQVYYNLGDLGFWRDMTCTKTIQPGAGGCSVTNWAFAKDKKIFEDLSESDKVRAIQDFGQLSADEKNRATREIDFAKNGRPVIRPDLGTVSMNLDGSKGFTRFYVHVPAAEDGRFARKLSPLAILDVEGVKFVPNLCTPCHAGSFRGDPDMGSLFREFDPYILRLKSDKDPVDEMFVLENNDPIALSEAQRQKLNINELRAQSEDRVHRNWFVLNKAIGTANASLLDSPTSGAFKPAYKAVEEYVAQMYRGVDPNGKIRNHTVQEDQNVPPTWRRQPGENAVLGAAKESMWKHVAGPYCMQCHRVNQEDFFKYENFEKVGNRISGRSDLEKFVGSIDEHDRIKQIAAIGDGKERNKAVVAYQVERGKPLMPNAEKTWLEMVNGKTKESKAALKAMREWLVQVGSKEPQVKLTFEIDTGNVTSSGEELYVVGSLQQIGAESGAAKDGLARPDDEKWSITRGLKLDAAPGGRRWTGTLLVPAGARFRWNMFVMSEKGELTKWLCDTEQTGARNQIRTVNNRGFVDLVAEIKDGFDDPSAAFQTITMRQRPKFEAKFRPAFDQRVDNRCLEDVSGL